MLLHALAANEGPVAASPATVLLLHSECPFPCMLPVLLLLPFLLLLLLLFLCTYCSCCFGNYFCSILSGAYAFFLPPALPLGRRWLRMARKNPLTTAAAKAKAS